MTGGGLVSAHTDKAGSSQVDRQVDRRHQEQPVSQDSVGEEKADAVWVFGYGSLLWKINFPYQDKVVGHVKGFARRFWQGSTDHRGVPGAPGRVVTLIEEAEEETWGIAYKVLPSDVPNAIAYLNHRERGGYTTHEVVFYPKSVLRLAAASDDIDGGTCSERKTFTVLAYIATELNPNYLGPAPIEDVAKQVVGARGPSGCNTEYILNLAHAMREIAPGVDDKHLFSLEGKVREQLDVKLKVTVTSTRGGVVDKSNLPIDADCTCNYCITVSGSATSCKETPHRGHHKQ